MRADPRRYSGKILSVELRQQYLLFSAQLYQIRNIYRRPTA
jgi:hypothetical protein